MRKLGLLLLVLCLSLGSSAMAQTSLTALAETAQDLGGTVATFIGVMVGIVVSVGGVGLIIAGAFKLFRIVKKSLGLG